MLKKYNIAAELLIAANAFVKKGNKKDGLRLYLLANEEADMDELVESLDSENEYLDDATSEDMVESEAEDFESEDDDSMIDEVESEAEEDEETKDEELPTVESVVAAIRNRKIKIKSSLSRRLKARKISAPKRRR